MNEFRLPRIDLRFGALTALTLAGAGFRLVPHPPNLTPIGAMALFGGAHFSRRSSAYVVPILSLLLSDLALALFFYGTAAFRAIPFVYLSFALTVNIGRWLRLRRSLSRLAAASIASALLFFVIANFGVWLQGDLYPRTGDGLLACYVAAIPYLRNMLLGNLIYSGIWFGAFGLACGRFPRLREERIPLLAQ